MTKEEKIKEATCDNNVLAVVFSKDEILKLSISDRIRLFFMKWDNKVTYYFNMSLDDVRWRELGWAINKEEFKNLIDCGSVILNDKEKTRLSVLDLEEFLLFHGF